MKWVANGKYPTLNTYNDGNYILIPKGQYARILTCNGEASFKLKLKENVSRTKWNISLNTNLTSNYWKFRILHASLFISSMKGSLVNVLNWSRVIKRMLQICFKECFKNASCMSLYWFISITEILDLVDAIHIVTNLSGPGQT